MSTEFKENDRVSINKDLTYTDSIFSAVKEMKSIFTGTVTRIYNDDEVIVMLDYPDDVPESKRISYSYDPRDLTLISRTFKPKRKKGRPILDDFDDSRTFPIPTNVKTSNEKTTVEFSDNTTTSVTKSAGDPYDLETAIAYCIAKKIVTNSCIKRLAKNAEEVLDKVNTEFYNKFLKPYGFLNESAYSDVEIETLKDYLKTLNDIRSDLALIAIENNLTKDELLGKLKG